MAIALPGGADCGIYAGGFLAQVRFSLSGVGFELVLEISGYHGPGAYAAPPARVSVHKVAIDNDPELYSGTRGMLAIDPGVRSGTVDEDLLGNAGLAHLSGAWRC